MQDHHIDYQLSSITCSNSMICSFFTLSLSRSNSNSRPFSDTSSIKESTRVRILSFSVSYPFSRARTLYSCSIIDSFFSKTSLSNYSCSILSK